MKGLLSIVKKALLSALVLILAIAGAFWTYFKLADGFNHHHITSPFAADGIPLTPVPSPDELQKINSILNQDFHYLAHGAQTFAFESADKKYVLKLVRRKHYKISKLEDMALKLPFLSSIREERLGRKKSKSTAFLNSCLLADKELRQETALLYFHVSPTKGMHPTINLYDRLGKKYLIDLDNTVFLLQEKAELVTSRISSLMKKNDLQGTKQALQQIVNLLISCSKKGIFDKDTNFNKNMGFVGNRAIFIDMGEFYRNERLENPEYCLHYLTLQMFPFKKWLWKNYPSVLENNR